MTEGSPAYGGPWMQGGSALGITHAYSTNNWGVQQDYQRPTGHRLRSVYAEPRRLRITGLTVLALLAAACTTTPAADPAKHPLPTYEVVGHGVAPADAEAFWELAQADDRVTDLLEDYGIRQVDVVAVPDDAGTVIVMANLAETAPDEAWPIERVDVCAIGHEPGITAVAWPVVDGTLSPSVSPRWGDTDCVGSLPIPDE